MPTDDNEKTESNGPGQGLMGPGAIIGIVAYILLFAVFIIYSLIVVWPPLRPKEVQKRLEDEAKANQERVLREAAATASPSPSPIPSPSPSPSPTPSPAVSPAATAEATAQPTATVPPTSSLTAAAAPTVTATPSGAEVDCEKAANIKEGFCLNEKGEPRTGVGALRYMGRCLCVYDEDRLLIIVMLTGALGALVHAFRSLSWYIGNRQAVMSWMAMYIMLPFLGAGLAVVFYLVIRGGFFSPTSTVDATSPFGFAALAALIGMFTEPAVIKLRKVATTIFEPPEKGKDHVGPAPKVANINPPKGPAGKPVIVTGSDFSAGVKVLFDKIEAKITAHTNTSITLIPPPHAPGKVDVTVINEDKQEHVVNDGFEYEPEVPGGTNGATGATGPTGPTGPTGARGATGPT